MKRIPRLGPGLLVTAAFIGPGTVTTASKAGASAGVALIWAVVFSVVAAIVLQEMAARLGMVARKSLGEAATDLQIKHQGFDKIARCIIGGLILAAIAYGNAAYQTGNLTGAAAGIESLLPADQENSQLIQRLLVVVMIVIAGAILFIGQYRWIERSLVGLVIIMSCLFVVTAFLARPNLTEIIGKGLVPNIPKGELSTVIGLIGTTVVPYNLFLHSQSVQERWKEMNSASLREARWDTVLSIGLGGIITAAIVIASASAFYPDNSSAADSVDNLARQLQPTVGSNARWMFALGLLAAGLTSSITAPLAAAYATCGVLRWKMDAKSLHFRAIWLSVLLFGGFAAFLGSDRPVQIIRAAQVANGLLLPGLAVILLWTVNRSKLMGNYRNGWIANCIAIAIVLFISVLTLRKLGLAILSWLG